MIDFAGADADVDADADANYDAIADDDAIADVVADVVADAWFNYGFLKYTGCGKDLFSKKILVRTAAKSLIFFFGSESTTI